MLEPYQNIWVIVDLIPEGCVASYGQIATLAKLPGRARMVSKWMSMAPKTIDLPWHRVVNSQGHLSIPRDSPWFSIQWELLVAEGILINDGKIKMHHYRWQPDMIEIVFALEDSPYTDTPDNNG